MQTLESIQRAATLYILHYHVYEFLSCNDLLSSRQSGFRRNHSCETAQNLIINDWLNSIYDGDMVGVMFIDFCKAFDMVDLLEKIKLYNLCQDSLSWLNSYLSNRIQQVKYKSKLSEPLYVTYGPLLCFIFINDLPLSLLDGLTQLSLFADDATYFVSNKNVKTVEKDLQICSNSIQSWCRSNHMVTNVDKTKVMLSGTRQKLILMNDHDKILNVFLNGNKFEQVTSEKLCNNRRKPILETTDKSN